MLQFNSLTKAPHAQLQAKLVNRQEGAIPRQQNTSGVSKLASENSYGMQPNQNTSWSMRSNSQQLTSPVTGNFLQMSPDIDSKAEAIAHLSTGSQPIIQRHSNPFYWCDALMRLIEYEDEHGILNTLVEYNSLNNDDLIPLNYNIPSIYGEVDVDWMLRLAVVQYPFIIGSIVTPSMSEGFGGIASRIAFIALKAFWVAIDPRTENWNWESIWEEGNWNSATVIVRWIHGQETLRDIFAPAIPLCQGQPTAPPDLREPTY